MEKTILEQMAEQQRTVIMAKNNYNYENEYNSNHVNALSDGNENGKGEKNGQVGSLTDINTRKENIVKNVYNESNNYNSVNVNALSDGDDKGKGENNGQVGSLTDINMRKDNITKNKYGESKTYPDFTI